MFVSQKLPEYDDCLLGVYQNLNAVYDKNDTLSAHSGDNIFYQAHLLTACHNPRKLITFQYI